MSYTIFLILLMALGINSQTTIVARTRRFAPPSERIVEVKFSYESESFLSTVYPQDLDIRCGMFYSNTTIENFSEHDLPTCQSEPNCIKNFTAHYVKFNFNSYSPSTMPNSTMHVSVEIRGVTFPLLNSSSAVYLGGDFGVVARISPGLLWCPHFPLDAQPYLDGTQIAANFQRQRRCGGALSFAKCESVTALDLQIYMEDVNNNMRDVDAQFNALINMDRLNAVAYDNFTDYLVGTYENYTSFINGQLSAFSNTTLYNFDALWAEVVKANEQTALWFDRDGRSLGSIRHEMYLNRFFSLALAIEGRENNIDLFSPFNNSITQISSVSRIDVGVRHVTYALTLSPPNSSWTKADVVGKFGNNVLNDSLIEQSCSFVDFFHNGSDFFARDIAGSPLIKMNTVQDFGDTGIALVSPPFGCFKNEVTAVSGSFDYYGVSVEVDFSNSTFSVIPFSPTIMFFGSSIDSVDAIIGESLHLQKYEYSKYVVPSQLNSALSEVKLTTDLMEEKAAVHSAQINVMTTTANSKCQASFLGICFTGAEHIVLFVLFIVIVVMGLLAGYHYYKKRQLHPTDRSAKIRLNQATEPQSALEYGV